MYRITFYQQGPMLTPSNGPHGIEIGPTFVVNLHCGIQLVQNKSNTQLTLRKECLLYGRMVILFAHKIQLAASPNVLQLGLMFCLIFSFLCSVLQISVCPFVSFCFGHCIVFPFQNYASDYPFGIFKLFFLNCPIPIPNTNYLTSKYHCL